MPISPQLALWATNISPSSTVLVKCQQNLAQAQESLLEDEEAISTYKQALSIDPNDTDTLYFMGIQYERMKRPNEALETYEKLLKIEFADEEVLQKVKNLKEQIELQKQIKSSENKTKSPKKKAKAIGIANSRLNLE